MVRVGTENSVGTSGKTRLDVRLVELGRAETRSRAAALILAGQVAVNGKRVTKAGAAVGPADRIAVTESLRYVSRGGLKLAQAIAAFGLDPAAWTVVDVGASTGGFTDCWLQHGAAAVYAVDVGYGQLDWRLRQDPRVVVHERVNARYLTLAQLGRTQPVDGASVDASFIGLGLLLRPLVGIVRPGGVIVALIKPQFEAGPRRIGRGGVVRDPAVHCAVLEAVSQQADALGLGLTGLVASPIRGRDGNIEFLGRFEHAPGTVSPSEVSRVVEMAWGKGPDADG